MKKLPPIMGWNTWNQFHQHITEEIVIEVANAMKENGLLAAGYRYLNLDDCWQASDRDENGRITFDVGTFPSKESIIGKLNALGFKAGVYSSAGVMTCEDLPGSYGNEDIDAQTFVDWGVEYLKYDYCHVVDIPTDPHYDKANFAEKTPPILYIGVTPIDASAPEIRLMAQQAQLVAPAVLEENAIVGLDCPRGVAKFAVTVPKGGEYQIAVGYKKRYAPHRKFVLIATGDSTAQLYFPTTSGWHSPSRATTKITLTAGENTILLTNPIREQKDDSILRYTRMGEALKKAAPADKPIYFSICEHGRTEPWTWAGDFAGSWRISSDISANWSSVLRCYEKAADLWSYQQPGAYNDPDMLEVGIGSLTDTENLTHFALWCMMSSPLILGLDVRKIEPKVLEIITNRELIALNQDDLMLQASRTKLEEGVDLLVKPLSDEG
ncbi:MAG: alpha-galactosidase, partial [Oscillospiraceae bacterium]|nr:alpha-galactosidase [Oscillospiraceae bacterium]